MIPEIEPSLAKDSEVQALLAFDEALAAGGDLPAFDETSSPLHAVHECQRLLEAIWPRSGPTALDLPGRFGRFSIVREVGRGGFGVVFLAVDPALRRPVALKVPRPEVLVTESIRRRFLREAEAASRLEHPHIIPVYEVGEEGPVCYIASAYCEGPTLADWLRRRTAPVPWTEAARLVSLLAAAVAHAHQRNILHRDLKPGNILLQPSERSAQGSDAACDVLAGYMPRICDFGLAKLLDDVSQETNSGLAIGSPPYMAPEQAAGRTREQGPATDVYALGVILYELLTGRPPLRGETDLETLRLVADRDPPQPRALRPGLPRDLESICLKCLEKRPERRYAGASELAEDLRRFLERRPIRARRASVWERVWKWVRRRPVHAALAAVVATVLLGGLGGLLWTRERDRRYNEVLVEALERSRRSEAAERKHRERLGRHESATQLKLVGSLVELGDMEAARTNLDAMGPAGSDPGSRGFPWSYLARLTVQPVATLPALRQRVRAVAPSPDGRTIALADDARQVYLMDLESGRPRALPGPHPIEGNPLLFFAPDGRTLAAIRQAVPRAQGSRHNVALWDVATGEAIAGMPPHLRLAYGLRFSPDGRSLVTVEATGAKHPVPVCLWAISDDRHRVVLRAHLSADQFAAHLAPAPRAPGAESRPFGFSDAVTVSSDREPAAAVWRDRRTMRLFHARSGYLFAVCVVAGDEVVAVVRTDKLVPYPPAELEWIRRNARALTGCDRVRLIAQDVAALWVDISSDGRNAAVLVRNPKHAHEGPLHLIDVGTGRVLAESPWRVVADHSTFAFAATGDELIVGGQDAHPRLWDIREGRRPVELQGHRDAFQKEVWDLAFSPDGRTLASASDDHTLKLWDVASGRERVTLRSHESLVTAVAYSPDGRLLASSGFDTRVRLWDAATGESLGRLDGHTERVRCVAFSPDGKWLASGGEDYQIRLWDVAARRERPSTLSGHMAAVWSLTFSSDGKTLYSAAGKAVWAWDPATGKALTGWPTPASCVRLAISPDGRTLAVAQSEGKVTMWDLASGRERATLAGHHAEVFGLAFSPDGRTLASAGADKTVRLWDPVTAQEILVLRGHEARVRAAVFSPDGTILATGSEDGVIKLWRGSPPKD